MPLQNKNLVTFLAKKIPLSSVGAVMIIQITILFKCLITIAEHIWLPSCMFFPASSNKNLCLNALSHLLHANGFLSVQPFMLLGRALLKCLVTIGACKWLLFCVCSVRFLKFFNPFKWFVTFGTGKWLLSYVGPYVHLQFHTCAKSLVTLWTGN